MKVSLGTTDKRKNSTKRPTFTNVYTGSLKNDCSVIRPVVAFNFNAKPYSDLSRTGGETAKFNPYAFNCAKIDEWDRYYYITDWEWKDGLWLAHMETDPLATFKTDIGAATFYIMRTSAASLYDLHLQDSVYPSKTTYKTYKNSYTDAHFTKSLSAGTYILSLATSGGLQNLWMSYTATAALFSHIFPQTGHTVNDYIQGILNQTYGGGATSLMSFIKRLAWLPLDYTSYTVQQSLVSDILLGGYATGGSGIMALSDEELTTNVVFTTVAPTGGWRGDWQKINPYTVYMLYYPPFGYIQLDGAAICANSGNVSLIRKTNLNSGICSLDVMAGSLRIGHYEISIMNDVAFGGQYHNPQQQAAGIAAGIAQIVAGAASENYVMAGAGVVSTASSMASYAAGQMGGASSGAAPDLGVIETITRQYDVVEEDIDQIGRPCYKLDTMSGGGNGYYKVSDGRIEISGAYQSELDFIKSTVEGGVHYE